MPEGNPIGQLQRHLVNLGCPARIVRRIVLETAGHYGELQQVALKQGLPPAEAAARAAEQLGDPRQLAERHLEVVRRSSWLTRNPILSFGVLPLAAMAGLGIFFAHGFGGKLSLDDAVTNLPTEAPWIYPWMEAIFYGSLLAITALVTFYFCRGAQRFAAGRRWMWITAGVLAAHGLFVQIQPTQWIQLMHEVTLKEDKVAPGRFMMIDLMGLGKDWSGPILLYHSIRDFQRPGEAEPRVALETILIVKPGTKVFWDGSTPLQDPVLQAQIAKSLAEIQADHWNHRVISLWEPGWTLIKAWLPHQGEETSQVSLEAYTPELFDAMKRAGPRLNSSPGQLRWLGHADLTVSLPVFFYSFPMINAGGWLHWFNVALPLMIVAVMVAWERRGVKRLEREAELGGAKVAGLA